MIILQDMTPEVYYNKSRDFQFIGRLYDLVLNYIKTNTELINNLPLTEGADSKLIDLLTMTLGFKSKHNYNIKQLTALCSSFAYIIRNKGTAHSIETACKLLLNAEGIDAEIAVNFTKDGVLEIMLPQDLSDFNLLKDLLNYIVPAGISVNIVKVALLKINYTTDLVYSGNAVIYKENNQQGLTDRTTSIVLNNEQVAATEYRRGSQSGLIVNSSIIKPATNNTEGD